MLRRLGRLLWAATDIQYPWRFGKSWRNRVRVSGHSMEPTLRNGDWLLVDPLHPRRYPRPGDLIVARDPAAPERWLVKRVREITGPHRFFYLLVGDHPAHAGDGEKIGPVGRDQLIGRPWLRYWPINRFGRLR